MARSHHERVCVDTTALGTLRRDGLGWGHDLDCGCFHITAQPRRVGVLARLAQRLKKGKS